MKMRLMYVPGKAEKEIQRHDRAASGGRQEYGSGTAQKFKKKKIVTQSMKLNLH